MGNDSEVWKKIHAMVSAPDAVSTILNSIRNHALAQIGKADGIVLCGATPFARAASTQEIWHGKEIEIEDFENGQLSIRGGAEAIRALLAPQHRDAYAYAFRTERCDSMAGTFMCIS